MGGLEKLMALPLMAIQASPCHILPGLVRPGHEARMIRDGGTLPHGSPGIIQDLLSTREESVHG
jgi:hypothetical protein